MIFVVYPNRRRPHLYLSVGQAPTYCTQCKQDCGTTADELIEHIHGHDTRKRHRRPVEIIGVER